ncbi:hypothetical protein BJ546DRAFT_26626 [Cryomyces antarcticus]
MRDEDFELALALALQQIAEGGNDAGGDAKLDAKQDMADVLTTGEPHTPDETTTRDMGLPYKVIEWDHEFQPDCSFGPSRLCKTSSIEWGEEEIYHTCRLCNVLVCFSCSEDFDGNLNVFFPETSTNLYGIEFSSRRRARSTTGLGWVGSLRLRRMTVVLLTRSMTGSSSTYSSTRRRRNTILPICPSGVPTWVFCSITLTSHSLLEGRSSLVSVL